MNFYYFPSNSIDWSIFRFQSKNFAEELRLGLENLRFNPWVWSKWNGYYIWLLLNQHIIVAFFMCINSNTFYVLCVHYIKRSTFNRVICSKAHHGNGLEYNLCAYQWKKNIVKQFRYLFVCCKFWWVSLCISRTSKFCL